MQNPLLDHQSLPRFGEIKPEHVVPAMQEALQEYQNGLDTLLQNRQTLDWAGLIDSEISWSERVSCSWAPVSHLNSVQDSPELRDVYDQALQMLVAHHSLRGQSRELCDAYKQLQDSEQFAELNPAQRRIIHNELRDFHRAGVDLDEADRQKHRQLVDELSRLATTFSKNVLDATNGWNHLVQDVDELKGLPETELGLLTHLAIAAGESGWLINLSHPSYIAVMTYADDASLREKVYQAYNTRASEQGPNAGKWDNSAVITDILAARHKLAGLLGFSNYAEYALDVRMAESATQVMEFLTGLAAKAKPAARQQFQSLQQFAVDNDGPDNLQAWDVVYWSEKLKQANFAVSDEILRPYFALPSVLEGLFNVVGRLFAINFELDESVAVWHPEVRYYWLLDESGERMAGIYMDLHARDEKRGGAWMDVCRSRSRIHGEQELPVAFLTCNFPPAADGKPALLSHYEVTTLFHEAGHCLHHTLTRIDYPQVGGIHGVEWDAVELPSQILENWCWEKSALDSFARHYQTGEPLPGELFDRMHAARRFQKAMMLVRQLEFALTDMHLHLDYNPRNPVDPGTVLDQVRQRVAVIPAPVYNRMLNAFSHIFGGGYSAGYYSYLWAEQLSSDAFERFKSEGIFNAETGKSLRSEILEVGGSRPALESFIAFRGRAPQAGALLSSYGIAGPEEEQA